MNEKDIISILQRLSSIEATLSHSSEEMKDLKKDISDLTSMRYDLRNLMEDHSERKQQWIWVKRGFIGVLITAIWGIYEKLKGIL
jgi:chromosome segregation ATPase